MSTGGRRPIRPGMIGGGVGQGGWVPGVNMPPLGYGLVQQQPNITQPQPHLTTPHQPPLMQQQQQQWQQQQQQQQQFWAQQAGMTAGTAVGMGSLSQQQQQQIPPHLQQQWMEEQRKAAEKQRKLYEQMMKQRHYDEQKMKLKAFNATKKAGVSADTMIESILGAKDPHKQRSPQPPKKVGGGDHGSQHAATTLSQAQMQRQGTAVDWSKMENVNSLFHSPKKTPTNPMEQQPHHPNAPNPNLTKPENQPAPQNPTPKNPQPTNVNPKTPLPIPHWLRDATPEVYVRATGLVAGPEGWVDTSRAYMLLMKTGLPPPLLGVLWEMVNCTAPGRLTEGEFTALLALVALVQSGQPIQSRDVLSTTTELVLPLIDHPALSPLVQDYIQARQQQQQQQDGTSSGGVGENNDDEEFDDFVSVTTTTTTAQQQQVPLQPSEGATTTSNSKQQPFTQPQVFPPPPQPSQKLPTQTADKRTMNLPKLGLSPELTPTESFDDEFDEFQSAAVPTQPEGQGQGQIGAQGHTLDQTTKPATEGNQNSILKPETQGTGTEDKYAVFRQIESGNEELGMESADDGFGEFCSSEVASINVAQPNAAAPSLLQCHSANGTSNTSPISFEVYSTPPEALPEPQHTFEADFSAAFSTDNYADIHEAMKRAEKEQRRKEEENEWASDPFGEFEEASGSGVQHSGSQHLPTAVPSTAAWLNVSGGRSQEVEEDFGDFIGAAAAAGDQTLQPPLENLGETQSVASLELPGLEMTVGVETSNSSPDLFLRPRGDVSGMENQLSGLSLESTPGANKNNNNNNQHSTAITTTIASGSSGGMDSLCNTGGLVDKYSIIREEASKGTHQPGEEHTGSWEKCLEGSVKLLKEAQSILTTLDQPDTLKGEVLATTQMRDYLADVQEVWLVCGRIAASSQRVTTSSRVDTLLSQAKTLWEEIVTNAEDAINKPQGHTGEKDNTMSEGEVCGVCLMGGGSKLAYGGHFYHPPCANLWLNCVDILLPSLTPVTLL